MSLRGPKGRGNLLRHMKKALISFQIGFELALDWVWIGFELALFSPGFQSNIFLVSPCYN